MATAIPLVIPILVSNLDILRNSRSRATDNRRRNRKVPRVEWIARSRCQTLRVSRRSKGNRKVPTANRRRRRMVSRRNNKVTDNRKARRRDMASPKVLRLPDTDSRKALRLPGTDNRKALRLPDTASRKVVRRPDTASNSSNRRAVTVANKCSKASSKPASKWAKRLVKWATPSAGYPVLAAQLVEWPARRDARRVATRS